MIIRKTETRPPPTSQLIPKDHQWAAKASVRLELALSAQNTALTKDEGGVWDIQIVPQEQVGQTNVEFVEQDSDESLSPR